MTTLTEAQREALLERAIDAVRARRDVRADTDPAQVTRLTEVARMAVTDAVTRGGHVHTLISVRAGVSGLKVIELIADWEAQGTALAYERNAARNYIDQVRRSIQAHVQQRIGAQGYGTRAAIAREFGVTPVTVDSWAKEDLDA